MSRERHAKLFKNGRSQAVRIPKEFELPGDEVVIRQEDGCLVLQPVQPQSLTKLLRTLEPIEDDFAPMDDKQPEPVEL